MDRVVDFLSSVQEFTGMYRKALELLRKSTRITTWGRRHTKVQT
jgi:hypothetical protein